MFILILMFGVFVQAVTGFGGTLIAVPFGIMLSGIALTKPVMTIVAWITGVIVVATEYRYINRRELLKMTVVMLVGVLGGLLVSGAVKLKFLLILYALVILAIGIRRLFFKATRQPPAAVQNIALALAGVMQGLFVSGGSFLAVYSVAKLPEKREFRATVNAVWAVINTVMIFTYFLDGALTKPVLIMSAWSVVPTLITVWLGALLTKYVRQKTFLKFIYVILIASGIVLLVTNL